MSQTIGKILKLFISIEGTSTRIRKENILVDKGGVQIDKFYKKDLDRSILLTSKKSYDMVKEKDVSIDYGQLGENLLIDYNPYDFEIGTKIQIGNTILEITQHCTLCKGLSKIDSCVPKLLKQDRGVFAKVLQEGIIYENDSISIIK